MCSLARRTKSAPNTQLRHCNTLNRHKYWDSKPVIMQDKSTLKTDLFTVIWFLIIVLAFLICLYTLSIDLLEISNRSLGLNTFFSQRSWLNDTQAILYCSIWISLFGTLLLLLCYNLYQKNKKKLIVVSVITIVLFISSIFIEPLFYNLLP